VDYVDDYVNYLTFQSPIYLYNLHIYHNTSLFFPNVEAFFSYLGLINGLQTALLVDSCFKVKSGSLFVAYSSSILLLLFHWEILAGVGISVHLPGWSIWFG
jgi:hypothetical protein